MKADLGAAQLGTGELLLDRTDSSLQVASKSIEHAADLAAHIADRCQLGLHRPDGFELRRHLLEQPANHGGIDIADICAGGGDHCKRAPTALAVVHGTRLRRSARRPVASHGSLKMVAEWPVDADDPRLKAMAYRRDLNTDDG